MQKQKRSLNAPAALMTLMRFESFKCMQGMKGMKGLMGLKRLLAFIFGLGLCLCFSLAQALKLTALTPQGVVAKVQQVSAQFDADAVRFGDPAAAPPITVECDNTIAAAGAGRWLSARQWVFDFHETLPDGVRCRVMPVSNFKSPASARLEARSRYDFSTGGPRLIDFAPYDRDRGIDERQIFLIQLSSPSTPQSVASHVWCNVSGIPARIPVAIIEGQVRAAVLQSMGRSKAAQKDPQRFFALRCKRALPAGAALQLVYGKGVETLSGVAGREEKRIDYKVQAPFALQLQCVKDPESGHCQPNREMWIDFNAPVKYAFAKRFTLNGTGRSILPTFKNKDALADDDQLMALTFNPPFAENSVYTLNNPADLVDYAHRPLAARSGSSPMMRTGRAAPALEFASSTFGILERPTRGDGAAMLPVTVSEVEPQMRVMDLLIGQANDANDVIDANGANDAAQSADARIISWMQKIERTSKDGFSDSGDDLDETAPLPSLSANNANNNAKIQRPNGGVSLKIDHRTVSLLEGQKHARQLELPVQTPWAGNASPFEMVGLPLRPGFHVLEAASLAMGQANLPAVDGKPRAMVVRTSVLVTKLAVHFKLGREKSLAWVTALDSGVPVSGARVNVSDCHGKLLALGLTDAQGIVLFDKLNPAPPLCKREQNGSATFENPAGYFVSARAADAKGVEDLAFVWSSWGAAFQPWTTDLPLASASAVPLLAHTVFDRQLFKAGETVLMKHYLRVQTASRAGLATPDKRLWPDKLVISYAGGAEGDRVEMPLSWRLTATGGLVAESSWSIPKDAKLGDYRVQLNNTDSERALGEDLTLDAGSFRVDQFRLPALTGSISVAAKEPLIAGARVPVRVQMHYLSGGSAAGLSVKISAMVRNA